MTHRNSVIHCNGIELSGNAACGPYGFADQSTHFGQMNMAGYEFREAVGYCDDGLTKVFPLLQSRETALVLLRPIPLWLPYLIVTPCLSSQYVAYIVISFGSFIAP